MTFTDEELELIESRVTQAFALGVEKGREDELARLRVVASLNGHAPETLGVRKALPHPADEKPDTADDSPHAALTLAMVDVALHFAEHDEDATPALNALADLAEDPAKLEDVLGVHSPVAKSLGATIFKAKWDDSLHPRDDNGRFVSKEKLQAAKNDPEKAKELRKRVTSPEQRAKLEKVLSGAADPGHTKRSQARADAAERRAKRAESLRVATKLAVRAVTNEAEGHEFAELVDHLPNLTVNQLRDLRSSLAASVPRSARREALIAGLVAHAMEEAKNPTRDYGPEPVEPRQIPEGKKEVASKELPKPVDESLWTTNHRLSSYGDSGAAPPEEHQLTDKGALTAFNVANKENIGSKDLHTLGVLSGNEIKIERRDGAKVYRVNNEHFGPDSKLVARGYAELVPGDERGYRITEKGKEALRLGREEADRLLERVKSAHPLTRQIPAAKPAAEPKAEPATPPAEKAGQGGGKKEPWEMTEGQKVRVSGADYTYVGNNGDGTHKVKNAEGAEFDTAPGESITPIESRKDVEQKPLATKRDHVQNELNQTKQIRQTTVKAVESEIAKFMQERGVKLPVGISPVQAFLTMDNRQLGERGRKLAAQHRVAVNNLNVDTRGDELHHARVHRSAVESALSQGKPVPPEVLADYPDLAAKYGAGKESPKAAEPATDDAVDRAHEHYQKLISDPDIGLDNVRGHYQPLNDLTPEQVKQLAKKLGYDHSHMSGKKSRETLIGHLEAIKLSQAKGEWIEHDGLSRKQAEAAGKIPKESPTNAGTGVDTPRQLSDTTSVPTQPAAAKPEGGKMTPTHKVGDTVEFRHMGGWAVGKVVSATPENDTELFPDGHSYVIEHNNINGKAHTGAKSVKTVRKPAAPAT